MVDVYDEYRQQIRLLNKNIDLMYSFVHQYEQGIRPIFSNVIHLIVGTDSEYQQSDGITVGQELEKLLHSQIERQTKDEVYDVAF